MRPGSRDLRVSLGSGDAATGRRAVSMLAINAILGDLVLAGSIREMVRFPRWSEVRWKLKIASANTRIGLPLPCSLPRPYTRCRRGRRLPVFVAAGRDDLRPLTTMWLDQTELIVNKLRDRGTHQALGVATNAQGACVDSAST